MKKPEPEIHEKTRKSAEPKAAKKPYRKPALKKLGLLRSAGSSIRF